MRLVVDSPAVQHVEQTWPEFRRDPRHLRFGLASDGVSPYGVKSSSHSIWPVVLTNYNVSPWLASKKGFLLLALIIPVKNIDIYLEPLVEELQQLWDGVDDVYDGRTEQIGRNRWFTLKGVLLWTMHDYPGYAQVSGFQTSGYAACPTCGPALPVARVLICLNRDVEEGHIPAERAGLKRWSILHRLPYWKDLMIQHILDPMHIEANVTKSLIKRIFGEKDGKPARRACEEFGVHPEAWIQVEIRFPTGFGSCLRKGFEKDGPKWPSTLKSHDYHILLQYVLPICLQGLGTQDLRDAICDLSVLMRWVCSKTIRIAEIDEKELFAITTLCKLEPRRRGRPFRFPSLRDFMREKLLQPEAPEESSGLYPPITEDIMVLLVGPRPTIVHDDSGLMRVNTSSTLPFTRITDEPYIYPSLVEQCFYVECSDDPEWSVAIPYIPRERHIIQDGPPLTILVDLDPVEESGRISSP
ncbi:hypothetical protein R1sor_010702 [Riccia sorocarpa]|uniref:Transposase n=1 Tax=Riccia sorocarpa TaxID=122646 RepID=A0ABD3I2U6_9MARC